MENPISHKERAVFSKGKFFGSFPKKIVLRIPHQGFQLGFEQFMIDRAFFGTINIFSWLN